MADKLTFEAALSHLEKIVAELERGELSLEQSIAKFEKGVKLAAECQKLLKGAEQKVQRLTKRREGSFDLDEWKAADGDEEDRKDETRT